MLKHLSVGLRIVIAVLVLLLIIGVVFAYYATVVQPTRARDQATATAQAQSTATAHTQQATATTQAQLANITATAQTQASATAAAQANINATATAAVTGPPTGFSVTTLHAGQVIRNTDIPLTIKGTYSTEGSGLVWIVLEDSFRNFFLQNPPVRFDGHGSWTATNIRPGAGITMVDFVYVTSAGNTVFQEMVDSHVYIAFSKLPDGSMILPATAIPIDSQVST